MELFKLLMMPSSMLATQTFYQMLDLCTITDPGYHKVEPVYPSGSSSKLATSMGQCPFTEACCQIQVFDLYGVGLRQTCSTPNILKDLNLKVGKLSTGDSLVCPQDESSIIANDATVKDMEGVDLDDFISGPRELLLKFVDKNYPLPDKPESLSGDDGVKTSTPDGALCAATTECWFEIQGYCCSFNDD